jgi:hypothetical protein
MIFAPFPQPIIWLRDRYLAGELELKPPFQRMPVWVAKQKSFLIESVLLELPIPEIYIQEELVERNGEFQAMYYVVDGQQRIRTVLQFMGIDKTESELEWNRFSLDKLPEESPFRDVNFLGLSKEQQGKFLQYTMAVRLLKNADDTAVRDMFKRLNRFLTKLNDQELRNATYTGPFIVAATALAEKKFWLENGLVSPAQIRRMKDIEFASELLIGVIHGPQAGSAKSIDEYYTEYEDYDDEFPNQKALIARFEATLATVSSILPTEENSRFRTNRTDFYTLFVAVAQLLLTHELPKGNQTSLQRKLRQFELAVDERLANEDFKASANVIQYVRAAEKGANEKARRADRHAAILQVISDSFKPRKS